MNTDLYYYSGTGNSLWVAREIAQRLEGSAISIPKAINKESGIQGDIIGIVCPIYMHNMPHIVSDFIKTIVHAEYLFFVYAGAGQAGAGISKVLNLFKSQGLILSSVFNIAMPSNYTPYGCPSEEEQRSILSKTTEKIDSIVATVQKRGRFFDNSNSSFWETHIHPGLVYKLGYPRIPTFDSQFSAGDACNGCGICENVCQVNNISIKDNKPVWNHSCQFCYACLNWCPQQAIESGKTTQGISRYHHPDVKIADIIDSSAM